MKTRSVFLAAILLFVIGQSCAKFDPASSPPSPPSETDEPVIFGRITADGTGMGNIAVFLAGPVSRNMGTDTNGRYAFSGLMAGGYTVSILNPNPAIYDFGNLSKNIQVGSSGSFEASFSGTRKSSASPTLAAIVGVAWLDENSNSRYDSGELVFSGATVSVSGSATRQVSTGSDGRYAFSGLTAGSYNVSISNPNSSLYRFESDRWPVVVGINDANGTVFIADFRATRR